jgi:hypothetical protein
MNLNDWKSISDELATFCFPKIQKLLYLEYWKSVVVHSKFDLSFDFGFQLECRGKYHSIVFEPADHFINLNNFGNSTSVLHRIQVARKVKENVDCSKGWCISSARDRNQNVVKGSKMSLEAYVFYLSYSDTDFNAIRHQFRVDEATSEAKQLNWQELKFECTEKYFWSSIKVQFP